MIVKGMNLNIEHQIDQKKNPTERKGDFLWT